MLSYMSTESLLNSFPMFGHPGISALEYAGQMEEKRKMSLCISEVSLKRKSTMGQNEENVSGDAAAGGDKAEESEAIVDCASSPVAANTLDELGNQQRRRGTFINHTPRNYEVRISKPVEVYRPSRESENFSRPLSRHGSMASNSPTMRNYQQYCEALAPNAMDPQPPVSTSPQTEAKPEKQDPAPNLDVYMPSPNPRRRSVSAPLAKLDIEQPTMVSATEFILRDAGYRAASSSSHKPKEKKRQRRQTPWKIPIPDSSSPRHAPLEPWVAEHRRKRTSETIGDVPFDMEREVSAEIGTFGVIQRYFDSQGGGPVTSPITAERALGSNPPDLPADLDTQQTLQEAIAMCPIDETCLTEEPPPVPDRSPKRLTNPGFPSNVASMLSTDTEFQFATEGQYSPYDKKDEELHVEKKRTAKRPSVGEAARAGSSNLGKMAPPILGHQALTASSDLGLNDLSYYLKHTGPSPEPQSLAKQHKHNGIRLFKPKPRKSLAARVGSVESSPSRPRRQPTIPACTKEMTTAAGSKHLKIIIPTETPRSSQALALPIIKARGSSRSRHVSITFTEEMLNPLGSPEVERIISSYETRERAASAPVMKSPRGSPKRTPKVSQSVPVTEHPLSASRDQLTRARKLRDLQRIKRKPVPETSSEKQNQIEAGALLTPAHTPEPVNVASSPTLGSINDDSGIDEESPKDKIDKLQDRVLALQRQNTQLTEALAKIVGLEIRDGEGGCDEVLDVLKRIGAAGTA